MGGGSFPAANDRELLQGNGQGNYFKLKGSRRKGFEGHSEE
jgi:hypothetical protein